MLGNDVSGEAGLSYQVGARGKEVGVLFAGGDEDLHHVFYGGFFYHGRKLLLRGCGWG